MQKIRPPIRIRFLANGGGERLRKREAMTAVTLACPLCAGNIQVDSALAGQQVACPLCHGALMLPPAEVLAQFAAPQSFPGNPQPTSQPPQEQVFTLGCPTCGNGLQVTAAMSGHQVACPYCHSPIVVPPLQGAQHPAPQTQSPQPDLGVPPQLPSPTHQEFDVHSLLPPGAELPPMNFPPAPAQRSPPSKPRETAGADRMPPSRSQRKPKDPPSSALPLADRLPPAPSSKQSSPPANDRFPPGFGGKPRDDKREEEKPRNDRFPPSRREKETDNRLPPRREPAPPTEAAPIPSSVPVPTLPPVVESAPPLPTAPAPISPPAPLADIDALLPPGMLPPGAEMDPVPHPAPAATPPVPAPSPVDHLLPPGGADVNTAAVGRPTTMTPNRIVDSLLPPGAPSEATSAAAPGREVPLPKMQSGPLRPVLAPGQPPPAQGLDRLQTVGREGKSDAVEEQEIKKLSNEEKARRRFRRNMVIWTVCVLILFAVFYFMSQ
jgi:hypothetical protein